MSLREVMALGAALILVISAASLGWGWFWGVLVAMTVYLHRQRGLRAAEKRLVRPSPTPADDVLWADAEKALANLERLAEEGEFREDIIRLAQAGRRAVGRARQAPADPAAVQTRHTLCVVGDALAAYVRADPARRAITAERVHDLLRRSTHALQEYAEQLVTDEDLCVHLRVLEQELQSMEPE